VLVTKTEQLFELELSAGKICTVKLINVITSIILMNTTISISKDLKEKIRNLGRAGDSYDDILQRMYKAACENMLKAYLYDESDAINIDEAIADAKKKWSKS